MVLMLCWWRKSLVALAGICCSGDRLAHDISPDNYPDEDGDLESEFKREQFILECLAQAKQRTESANELENHKEKATCAVEKISEKLFHFSKKQNNLEQLNNEINSKCHGIPKNNNADVHVYNIYETVKKNNICNEVSQCKDETKCSGTLVKTPRRPRKLPEIPKNQNKEVNISKPTSRNENFVNERCLADELQEALRKESLDEDADDDVFLPVSSTKTTVYPKFSSNFLEELKQVQFCTVSKNTRAYLNSNNPYLLEDSTLQSNCSIVSSAGRRRRESSDGDGPSRKSSSACSSAANCQDLEVTHHGMHKFLPRHSDEMMFEIGDPIHVTKEADDLWCEGVNLRTGQRGIFPSMYATDLNFLEEDAEEDGVSKFNLRFLGSVEVNFHKGDEVLCQAINRVALSSRAASNGKPPPSCTIEISQYGIRMIDKSKIGHENDDFTHFFALKNISFCGYHPRNERYFAFITKHPKEYRFACHVFLGEKSTRSVSEAVGNAFKRFYQEYMAFTHQTEDIYME